MAPVKGAPRPLTVVETEGRFRVGYLANVPLVNFGQHKAGWVVCDRDRPITIAFDTKDEAVRHRDKIAEIYERYVLLPCERCAEVTWHKDGVCQPCTRIFGTGLL